MYVKLIKPALDILCASIAFILLSPIFLVVCVLLYRSNEGKPFFYQPRPGLNGKVFNIIKFKSMNDKKDANGNLLPDHLRITKLGAFVRKSSLDEIPQLLNVIKGQMSIVGPRPLRVAYLTRYNEQQQHRHDVRPGITGWAQINGRNTISWEEKFKYDVWYVNNIGFMLDLQILFKTVIKVFKSEGISASEEVTMEEFMGTAKNS
ncbi:sugar transferase [Flavimarina sp. Hel_I_48]|uniref:sugar transferase n=1 Tax=Flavimarina sp. Hel_I_48 TaxID=1392488 RepID=UPI0004DF4C7A|nr:sugar transferase [Flavimarina sp. Hel_I_48]